MNTGAGAERKARFERVVVTFYRDLFRYAAWLSRDPDVAEVVVQESLLRAWKSLDGLREDDAARQWLLTIVRRENARYFDGRGSAALDIDDLSPAQESMITTADDPDLLDLRRAIFRLEPDYREPLVLQVLMGHTCREIAEIMGLKQGAVLTRLHRARNKLRQAIDGDATGVRVAGQTDGL
jgi:RNA polymerase sigma-70 factor (ECF subfamily)